MEHYDKDSENRRIEPVSSMEGAPVAAKSRGGLWLLLAAFGVLALTFFSWDGKISAIKVAKENRVEARRGLEARVLPPSGVELPVSLGDLGAKMASVGVIDKVAFINLYKGRGGPELAAEAEAFFGEQNGKVLISERNAGILLNLFWALGLGNKSEILEKGPMTDTRYGGAGNFASTGGWTIAEGGAMNHYSRHPFIVLTESEASLVEKVSRGIFRPCCNNPTFFPDCNHGMAMLGLLELMASQGLSEDEMFKTALTVNSYWFPDTYITIASYWETEHGSWETADPKIILGRDYSSASGFQAIVEKASRTESGGGGGSCGA